MQMERRFFFVVAVYVLCCIKLYYIEALFDWGENARVFLGDGQEALCADFIMHKFLCCPEEVKAFSAFAFTRQCENKVAKHTIWNFG